MNVSIKDASISKIVDEPELTVKFEGFENLEDCRKFLLNLRETANRFSGQTELETAEATKQ